jgi:hypothetical protein
MAINAQKRLREFTALCTVLEAGQLDNALLDTVAEIYVELREKNQTIEDADIMTAAFCKIRDFALVTHNIRHFDGISGFRYCDWVLVNAKAPVSVAGTAANGQIGQNRYNSMQGGYAAAGGGTGKTPKPRRVRMLRG